ncbi:maleylpyruvate isomerase N-terminal domain-containing protein [Thalassospira alkalitolerans]|uniref:maleylpyruvate isomerase N-terminal domain-containing protein n=1 Tax=Thalassospira alkalitolerans TaxID=1293890 RepID=UPI003C6FBA23
MTPGASDKSGLEALKARQGAGARYDAPDAPGEYLLLARRGSAFFARKLNELSDVDLDAPSLRKGWSRRHVVVDVCYSARVQAIALKTLREPLTPEEEAWKPNLRLAATLPPRAIRHLYEHTSVHLNVEYRDLANDDWKHAISFGGQSSVPVRELPLRRAYKIWNAAYHLATGAKLSDLPDFPPGIQSTLSQNS